MVAGNLAVAATLAGMGPFAHESPEENALLVQLFLITTACVGLALSTSLDEREALVTELRQRTDEATDQAQLLNAVVNSMAEGLIVVDDSGRWLLRNPAASRVGGLAEDLRALISSADGGPDPLTLALAGETVRDRELEVVGPKGQGRILALSATPLPRDPATGQARALLIFRDATIEHARRVDLTAFADVVAHDLRNPLAAVENWTEMMAAELVEGDVEVGLIEQYVERVGVGSRRMKDLIEGLLDRATSSTSALQLRRVDVGALAEEVATDHDATDQVTVGMIPAVHADPAGAPGRGQPARQRTEVRRDGTARPGPGHLSAHRGAARRLHHGPRQRSRRCGVRVHAAGARLAPDSPSAPGHGDHVPSVERDHVQAVRSHVGDVHLVVAVVDVRHERLDVVGRVGARGHALGR